MVPLEDLVLEQVVPVDLVVVVLLAELLDPQLHLDKEMLVELVILEVLIWEVAVAAQVALVLVDLLLALVVSVFAAIPIILYQLWRFVAPGLYRHEKRLAFPLLFSSVLLFYAGAAFAYYVVFPLVFGFFTAIGPEGIVELPDISSYLNFVLKMFFAFGVAFEIPIATVLLVLTGATTPDSLAAKRPYVVVACFVIGMLLTPPDIISQTLLAVPMWILFEVGILFGRLAKREVADPESDEPAGE